MSHSEQTDRQPDDRERAARRLVQEHALVIGRACMALLGSQREAEDVLREVLLAALAEPNALGEARTERARLLGIARRCAAKRLETRVRERRAVTTTASDGALRPSLGDRARRLLEDVRPTEREALVLRFAAGLDLRELGEACGVDAATAQTRVSRGLLRSRALLREDEA